MSSLPCSTEIEGHQIQEKTQDPLQWENIENWGPDVKTITFIKRKNRREEVEKRFLVSKFLCPTDTPTTLTCTHTQFVEEVNSIPHFLHLAQIRKVECPVICINSKNDL